MANSVKKPLIERVAESLRREMIEGGGDTIVPSCRELAAAMKVSVPTAMEALRILKSDGFLIREQGMRRYQRAVAPDGDYKTTKNRLLVIRPLFGAALDADSRMRIDRLVMESTASGWIVQEQVLSFGSDRRRPDRRWDELVKRFQPTRIVVSSGTPLLADWALKTGIDTLFLGGSAGSTGIPTLGVSLSASLCRLLPRLLASGETLVSMPFCGYGHEFIEAFHRAFKECLEDAGLQFVPTYHTPATTERGPEAFREMLAKVLCAKPPTSLIFVNCRHYMASLGLLGEFGLIPGKTLKVAILWYEEDQSWLNPRPATFRYPGEKIWKLMLQWMRHPHSERFHRGAVHIPAEFVPGCGIE